jgi:hypothetical protein
MKKICSLGFFLYFLALPQLASAAVLDILPCFSSSANCSLENIETGFILLTKLLIGAVGAAALLYFIWGGIQWLTSYGNLEKVRHGRQIMLHTTIAIVVAFMSFILVEFFVNDLLNAENKIKTDCEGIARNTACNTDYQNYVCTGTFSDPDLSAYDNLCMSKCDLKNIEDTETSWVCLNKDILSDGVVSTNDCPDSKQFCVDVGTLQIMTEDDLGYIGNDVSLAGCCIRGPNNCAPGQCSGDNGQFRSLSCSEYDTCNLMYHTSGCCIEGSTCRSLNNGGICDTGQEGVLYNEKSCLFVPGC